MKIAQTLRIGYFGSVLGTGLILALSPMTVWGSGTQKARMPSFQVFDALGWYRGHDLTEGIRREDYTFSVTEKDQMKRLSPKAQNCVAKTISTLRRSAQFMKLAPYLREVTIEPAPVNDQDTGESPQERVRTTLSNGWLSVSTKTEQLGFGIGYSAMKKSMFFSMYDCEKAQPHLDQEIKVVYIDKSLALAKDAAEKDEQEFSAKQIVEDIRAIQDAVGTKDRPRTTAESENPKKLVPAPVTGESDSIPEGSRSKADTAKDRRQDVRQ